MQNKFNKHRNEKHAGITYGRAIKSDKVRLTDDDESYVISTKDALNKAYEQSLELVVINDKATPPVCKIVDLNKFLYERKQREKQAKKKQREAAVETKEIRMGLNIDVGDIQTKCRKIKQFLDKDNQVTLTVQLRGRERGKPELAVELLHKFADILDVGLDKINTNGNRISAKIKKDKG